MTSVKCHVHSSFGLCSHQKCSLHRQESHPITALIGCSDLPQSSLEAQRIEKLVLVLKGLNPCSLQHLRLLKEPGLERFKATGLAFEQVFTDSDSKNPHRTSSSVSQQCSQQYTFHRPTKTLGGKWADRRRFLKPSNANYDTNGDSNNRVSSTLMPSPLGLLGQCRELRHWQRGRRSNHPEGCLVCAPRAELPPYRTPETSVLRRNTRPQQ